MRKGSCDSTAWDQFIVFAFDAPQEVAVRAMQFFNADLEISSRISRRLGEIDCREAVLVTFHREGKAIPKDCVRVSVEVRPWMAETVKKCCEIAALDWKQRWKSARIRKLPDVKRYLDSDDDPEFDFTAMYLEKARKVWARNDPLPTDWDWA
jgi:hypothetical protein